MLIHFGNGHINLFIYIYIHTHTHIYTYNFFHLFLFRCVLGLRYYAAFSLVVASRGYSWLQFTDFSLWWLLLLWSTASRCPGFSSCSTWAQECIFWALEHRFSSCGAWAQPLRWHVGSSQTPCLLHWQADSLLLNHQGSPVMS